MLTFSSWLYILVKLSRFNNTSIQTSNFRIFGLWFGSPIEAWAAQNVIKNYFKTNSLPPPDIGVYRHAVKNKRVIDWDDYFSNVRSEAKEESKLRYKNWVKSEMGKKRLRKGRYKFRETFR